MATTASPSTKPRPGGVRPVKPPPKPKSLKFVRAVFAYQGSDEDELSFEEGDLLYIVDDKSDKDWWRARCRGKEGLVPANFLSDSKTSQGDLKKKKEKRVTISSDLFFSVFSAAEFNPMHDACRRGHVDLLSECLSNRAPVNSMDKAGNTPLHWAAVSGQVECVKKLLEIPQINVNVKVRQHKIKWKFGNKFLVEIERSEIALESN